ncbi:MAG: hypothetical protein LKF36_14975 [Lactobacillus sp.]|jgi:phosphoglycerate dehydrogenase-like enzyme|nr:hypothetical protein [Lactobacillus sp.]
MTKTMLAMRDLKPAQLTQLQTSFPDLTVLTMADLSEANLNDINIIYGYYQTTAGKTLLDQLLASSHSQLQWVQTISAGVDYLPFKALNDHHILVTNASGIHAQSIAQNVFGYLLYFERALDQAIVAKSQKHYGIDTAKIVNLDGKRLLIFGPGHVGQQIAKVAKAFNMTVYGVSHSGQAKADFDKIVDDQHYETLLDQADYIVNIMPLTPETTKFFNKAFFDKLTTQPIFINVGRGPSVDEAALHGALTSGQLHAAALDVFDPEPLAATSPLWDDTNLMITPHTSGYVQHFSHAYFNVFLPNLTQFMQDGTLVQNLVDMHKHY